MDPRIGGESRFGFLIVHSPRANPFTVSKLFVPGLMDGQCSERYGVSDAVNSNSLANAGSLYSPPRKIIRIVLSRPARPFVGDKFGPFGIEWWPITSPSAFYHLLKFGEDRKRKTIRFGPVRCAQASGEILPSADHRPNRFRDRLTNSPFPLPKL